METSQQRGFTMIELIVVVAIVGILLALGAPSYRYVTTANRVSSEVNGLLGDMQFARAESIKEGQTISVCPTTDSISCVTGGTSWQGGWLLFQDANGNGAIDAGDNVLRIQKPIAGGDTVTSSVSIPAVTFNREGFAVNLGAAGVTFRLHDSSNKRNYTRCLLITIVGALTTQPYDGVNCT